MLSSLALNFSARFVVHGPPFTPTVPLIEVGLATAPAIATFSVSGFTELPMTNVFGAVITLEKPYFP